MTTQAPNIRGIHPLTPTQQGILFHTLLAPAGGVYVVQTVLTLQGDVQPPLLQRAWQAVVDRHDVLRSQFVWKGQERPLQIVRDRVELPWKHLDWLGSSATEQRTRLEAYLDADRRQGFDVSRAPLVRVTLIRTAENRYSLICTVHHVVLDGWSLFLVIQDVIAAYRALRHGRAPQLPPCRPYRDYLAWLRRQDGAKAENFWRAALEGFKAPTPLAVDKPAVTTAPHADDIASEQQQWSSGLTGALRAFAARHGLTLSTLVQGAWALLLSRYSGERRVLFGSVVAGRPADLAGVESMVGLFINTLPVPATISPEWPVVSWLKGFQDHLISLQEHGYSSLIEVQGWSDVRRERPLFESLLAFENYRIDPSIWQADADFEITGLRGIERTNYPLSVTIRPGEEVSIRVDYSTGRFDNETITRLLGHLQTILAGFAADANRRLSDVPLLTEPEREQVLVEWNRTTTDFPGRDRCLHELVEEQTRRTPDRVAVVFEGQSLTYDDLNRRANHVAHHLRTLGVTRETMVGLFVERSLEMVVGLLGILKAGAAYVPLDPSFPTDRLDYMLRDAGIPLLATQSRLLPRVPPSGRTVVCLDRDWEAIQGAGSANPAVPVNPSNLAYTIYTSGSTGAPKGVMIEHRSLVNALLSMQREPGFDGSDVLVAVTTISFDIAALEIFLPLISGGKLVLASSREAIDGSLLLQLIERSRATTLQATPATWKLLIEAGWVRTPGLRMLCGGEALSRDLANRLLERGGELWNMYGPTETTIWSSARRIVPAPGPVPIGPPLANTRFYVVDAELQPVPIGVAGELVIGGDGLSRGYLNRPDLTAERFVQDPFRRTGERLYKTGDLVRHRQDGGIEFLGRRDFQVKVRGYRIELGEIEHALLQHPDVKDAVVTTSDDHDGDRRLVAYYVPATTTPPTADDLRQMLRAKLPPYMIPSVLVPMAALPLTANGKIDRKALPSAEETQPVATRAFVGPRDPLEHALVRAWSKVLKIKDVGLHDSFFDLGGHSLAAMRLVSEIQELTGKSLPLAAIFEAPTVAALADILRRDGWSPSWSSLVPIETRGSRTPLFLAHAAHGHILLYRRLTSHLGPDQPVYGLQSEGLNGDGHLNTTVEEMAVRYLEDIVTVQPHGPYLLGGYCLGGLIALEIAQQLTARGEYVEAVFLLDSYNPGAVSRSTARLCYPVHLLQNLWFHAANTLSIAAGERAKFLRDKLDVARARLALRLRATRHLLKPGRSTTSHRNRQLAIQRINDEAAARYAPRPYAGRTVLIRSKRWFWRFTDPSFGWSAVVRGDLVVHELPVYPKGMLIEPYCRLLADAIRRAGTIPVSPDHKTTAVHTPRYHEPAAQPFEARAN